MYYIDEELGNSDYYFCISFSSPQTEEAFLRQSESQCKKYELEYFTVNSRITDKRSIEYTIYANPPACRQLQRKLCINKKTSDHYSLFSGSRRTVFRDISTFQSTTEDVPSSTEYYFMLNGSHKHINAFRAALIDKYGLSNPSENGKQHDALMMVVLSWVALVVLILIFESLYLLTQKREIAIRLINGSHKPKEYIAYLLKWGCEFVLPFFGLFWFSDRIGGAQHFGTIAFLSLLTIIAAVCIIIYRIVGSTEVHDIGRKNHFSLKTERLLTFSSCLLLVLTLISIPVSISNVNDGLETYSQKKLWNRYSKYSSVYFISKGEDLHANSDLDLQYRQVFYNRFLDTYDITVLLDLAENGGDHSAGDKHILYANINAVSHLTTSINLDNIKKGHYYIISSEPKNTLWKDNGFFEGLCTSFNERVAKEILKDGTYIHIDHPYKITTLDINNSNLGNNIYKNPTLILDTHTKLASKEMGMFSLSGILKCSESDYYDYIQSIGYSNEHFYINSVRDLYAKKLAEKQLLMTVNAILLILWLLLFNLSIRKLVKEHFKANAIEIITRKLNGTIMVNRYQTLIRPFILSFALGSAMTFILYHFFLSLDIIYILIGLLVTFLQLLFNVVLFIKKTETKNISNVLKGEVIN